MAALERLEETIELYEMVDRSQRIEMLIDTADRYREVPEEIARRPYPEERKVPACESEAYVWAMPQDDGTLRFYFAIENPQGISAKALAVVLGDTLSGEPLEQVAEVDVNLIYRLFGRELSMGKSMGLMSMVGIVRNAASRRLAETG